MHIPLTRLSKSRPDAPLPLNPARPAPPGPARHFQDPSRTRNYHSEASDADIPQRHCGAAPLPCHRPCRANANAHIKQTPPRSTSRDLRPPCCRSAALQSARTRIWHDRYAVQLQNTANSTSHSPLGSLPNINSGSCQCCPVRYTIAVSPGC